MNDPMLPSEEHRRIARLPNRRLETMLVRGDNAPIRQGVGPAADRTGQAPDPGLRGRRLLRGRGGRGFSARRTWSDVRL